MAWRRDWRLRPVYGLIVMGFKIFQVAVCFALAFSESLASDFVLAPGQSEVRYTATKYGSMLVEGTLSSPQAAGLSGEIDVYPAGGRSKVSGEVRLTQVRFDSQHARRDDEVNALFKTPIALQLSSPEPCLHAEGRCVIDVLLSFNGHQKGFPVETEFYRKQDALIVQGVLAIDRREFDLVFKEGFASTLDMAISPEIDIGFRLLFEAQRQTLLDNLPVSKVSEKTLESAPTEPTFLDRLRTWLK